MERVHNLRERFFVISLQPAHAQQKYGLHGAIAPVQRNFSSLVSMNMQYVIGYILRMRNIAIFVSKSSTTNKLILL